MRFFMQQISDMDERVICPNAFSPRSWYDTALCSAFMMHCEVR